jgi:hypothetical protein
MGIFGGRGQAQAPITPAELATAVPSDGDALGVEAEAMAAASDRTLRSRFAMVWPRGYEIPSDPEERVEAVRGAVVSQDREEVVDLRRRADAIALLPEAELARSFGVSRLPSEPGRRLEASLDLAAREVEGFEGPRLAAERTLDRARSVRDVLSIDRDDADRFRDVSPLARLVWKHVPEMAARIGVQLRPGEGYAEGDAERGNAGLAIHNSGADSRAASRIRMGFSQSVNGQIDALIGTDGSGGAVRRLIESSAQIERRFGRQGEPARSAARDMSAAAFLSGVLSR